jgi:hypothetical protein
MNRLTQVFFALGALGVAAIVGFGAMSGGTAARAKPTPRPTPPPLVALKEPDGWTVLEDDAVLRLVRGPTSGQPTVARITVCRNAYGINADGTLTNGLDTDATAIAFALARRPDLSGVVTPHAAKLGDLQGTYLDFKIPASPDFGADADIELVRAELANCAVGFDTSDTEGDLAPDIQIGVPNITRFGIFSTPDGSNVMVLIASEGIGIRGMPTQADIDEASDIVAGFSVRIPPK